MATSTLHIQGACVRKTRRVVQKGVVIVIIDVVVVIIVVGGASHGRGVGVY